MEDVCQRVGDVLGVAAVGVFVVDGLYAPSAGNVILAGCQFEGGVVRQVHRSLYESLAVGACAEDDGTVEVLQAAAGNLAGTCRLVVYQHDNRHHRVNRFHGRLVFFVRTLQFAHGLHQRKSFRHEHIDDVDSLQQTAAAVVAQVEDK